MKFRLITLFAGIIILSMTGLVGAESANIESSNYNLASSKFVEYYNKDQYKDIFEMFTDEMKNALPLESTSKFFTAVKEAKGNIISKEYIRRNAVGVIYKLTFERAVCSLKLTLDDSNKINGIYIEKFIEENLPIIDRNITKLSLPFKGEWYVVWGGDTKEQNYHIVNQAQKNAFDFVIMGNQGKTYKSEGKSNEDYYAFNQPIQSPCNAEVVMVVDGVKDNIPGNLNPYFATGNTVVLKTRNEEFIILAHFKRHSIVVKEGDKVALGDLLGYCGNSGNSSEPHLHMHIQNVENMNIATGVKAYFDKIVVNNMLKSDYSPVRGERLNNIE